MWTAAATRHAWHLRFQTSQRWFSSSPLTGTDYAEIANCIHEFFHCVDTGNGEKFADLFTASGSCYLVKFDQEIKDSALPDRPQDSYFAKLRRALQHNPMMYKRQNMSDSIEEMMRRIKEENYAYFR